MKRSVSALAAMFCLAWPTWGQVSVEVKLDQEQFLPNEDLVARVRVTNVSGQTLPLGDTPDWLMLSVEGGNGVGVRKLAEVPVVGAFQLESSSTGIKRVNLAPYYNLSQPGRYTIV